MDLPPEEQHRLQMQDPICQFIKSKLEGDSEYGTEEDDGLRFTKRFLSNRLKNFKMDNYGVIWGQEGDKWLLYLPKGRQAEALRKAHDSDIGGHRDWKKTYERIKVAYFWISMISDIKRYIQNCEKCQRAKQPHSKASITAPLKPLEIPSRFNDRVHVDLMGPLRSNGYNKYVMVMSDAFTKWIELVPIPDKAAETIANAIMENWIYRNSAMEVLVSDNGKEFRNETMADLCKEMDIKHKFTSPYHPQSNAQCERQNRTILDYLRTTLEDNTLDWEKKIRACQFSYNTQVHNSTRYSPYYLRHLMAPTVPIRPTNDRESCGETWTEEASQRLNNAWGEVRDNLTKASQNQKQQYDRHTTKRTFRIGDKVLVKNHKTGLHENRKLKNPWIGPYRIVDVVGDTNLVIQKSERGKKILIHTNEVKLFKENNHHYSPENEFPTGSNEEGELPDVDEPQPGTSQEAAGDTEEEEEEETPPTYNKRSSLRKKRMRPLRPDPNDPNLSKSDFYTFRPDPKDPELSKQNGCFDYDPSYFEGEPYDPRKAEYCSYPTDLHKSHRNLFSRDVLSEPVMEAEPQPSTSRSDRQENTAPALHKNATNIVKPKSILKVSVPKEIPKIRNLPKRIFRSRTKK